MRCSPSHSSWAKFPGLPDPPSANDIVDHYLVHHKPRLDGDLAHFRNISTLMEALDAAAMAQGPKGKFSHQQRLRWKSLNESRTLLLPCEARLNQATSFDEILQIIRTAILNVNGVGVLYYYDTSLRVAARLDDRFPKDVYLHAGPREGAKALRLDHSKDKLPVSVFAPAFSRLQPHEIENLLCIYRSVLPRMI
ncbi:MAG: hypothetical protein ABI583_00165 [Betaproteobacteria bacterium]